jgi:hypothetical protein
LKSGALLLLAVTALVSTPAQADPLRVVVRPSSGDTTVANAYVSLVPPHRPWSRPAAETVAREGVAVIDVPPGAYRIVAGAPGSGLAVKGPVTVSPQTAGEVEIRLPSLQTVSGTVRDDAGQPLAGVTISDVNAAIEAPLGRMSELARRHLAAHWKTVSAADGSWSLSIPTDSKNPLVAELPGRAAAWQPYQGGDAPVAFVAGEGATLRVTLDRADPNVAVTLVAHDEKHAVPAHWQGQFRARRAVSPVVSWDSLAPGSYDLYAQPVDPRSFAKAAKLGSVTLERGASRDLAFALPAVKPVSKDVTSFFLHRMSRAALASLETFGRDTAGAPKKVAHALEEVSGGTLIHVDGADGRGPFYGITSDRFIALAAETGESADVPHAAEVLERTEAGLHVRSGDPAMAIPAAGLAAFHECGAIKSVSLPVAVKKDGTVLFAAPAGCRGLRLAFDPFGPLTLPRALAASGETEWLGDFTLYAGGTAGVHVVNDGGEPVIDGAVGIHARTGATSESLPVATSKTRADGWVYFENLPSGRELYAIATTAEGRQSAPRPFRVQPREQTLVDVVIPRAATLIIKPELDPEFLKLFPQSHIELLILDPENEVSREEQRREEVHERESVTFRDMQPGRWRLLALIATGTTMQPVRGELVELAPGNSKEITAKFKPLVFRGRVTLRGKGVKGNLDVIGAHRGDIVPSIGTSESGEFTALLQRADTYQVGVRTREPFRMMWIGDVDFSDPALFIELTVPENEVVVAVRADGQPVRNATVTARLTRDAAAGMQTLDVIAVVTDANGEARLDGVLPGPWIVTATAENGDRRAEKRVIVGDRKSARVELELSPSASITGTVRQPYGAPVAGARIACLIPSAEGPAAPVVAWSADDGTFKVDGARGNALCSVTSLFGSDGYRVAAGASANLTLPAKPASLQVVSLPPVNRMATLWLVSEDGRLIDVSPYLRSSGTTATLDVAAIAPQRWKLVRVASVADWVALTGGSAALLAPLADVTLEAGQKKLVNLENRE